jgi:glycine dehydrogenase subunit 1
VQTKSDPHAINNRLIEKKIIGGFATMQKFYPELSNASVWCVTEMNSREQIDAAAQEVSR